jgi:SAM-dependent methyltransferase
MALMLMDDIEMVLREIRRVLRPQGELAAMAGRTFLLGEVNEIFLGVFRPIAKEDTLSTQFGDRRTGTTRGWTELLQRDFRNLQFEDIDVDWAPHPDELWNALTETYDIDRLSGAARERLRKRLLDAIAPLQQGDGTIRTGWGLRLVRAQAY